MKRLLFSLIALLSIGTYAMADHAWTVSNITIPQGKTAVAAVYLTNGTSKYRDFQCDVVLPNGLTFVKAAQGELIKANKDDQHSIATNNVGDNTERIVCSSNAGDIFSGTKAPFLLLTLQADASLTIGTELTVKISGIEITEEEGSTINKINPADISFTATIESAVKVLDETSTTLPDATDKAYEVKVNRTINANEWSTLCLPFAMSETQLKDAFGDDVKLADFKDYESDVDADDNIVAIHVNFTTMDVADGLEANYPVLIRTASDITSFTVEATIQPNEEDAALEYTKGSGSRAKVLGTFQGTLKAGDYVPQNGLFLNGNKFYYSTGNTAIKAFRGYFKFVDVLTSVEEASANVRVVIDGQTTRVEGITNAANDNNVYTLDGRRASRTSQTKGVYIQNGKKVVK